ncbi:MAG: hypothetical protein KDK54_11315 [Leptospiraceae bacterium]|nr:hypothetical protein [Leptospiraceae bacterium]
MLFGRIDSSRLFYFLEESGTFKSLKKRYYFSPLVKFNFSDPLDNKVMIHDEKNRILINLRFSRKEIELTKNVHEISVLSIDWLMTQNVKFKNKTKKLYSGQEFPGLNIFNELSRFFEMIYKESGFLGISNTPEYFHDAFLFKNHFKYIDPIVQGEFLAIFNSFKGLSLRKISSEIHSNRIIELSKNEIFQWKHSPMLYTNHFHIHNKIFNKDYYDIVKQFSNKKYSLLH